MSDLEIELFPLNQPTLDSNKKAVTVYSSQKIKDLTPAIGFETTGNVLKPFLTYIYPDSPSSIARTEYLDKDSVKNLLIEGLEFLADKTKSRFKVIVLDDPLLYIYKNRLFYSTDQLPILLDQFKYPSYCADTDCEIISNKNHIFAPHPDEEINSLLSKIEDRIINVEEIVAEIWNGNRVSVPKALDDLEISITYSDNVLNLYKEVCDARRRFRCRSVPSMRICSLYLQQI